MAGTHPEIWHTMGTQQPGPQEPQTLVYLVEECGNEDGDY